MSHEMMKEDHVPGFRQKFASRTGVFRLGHKQFDLIGAVQHPCPVSVRGTIEDDECSAPGADGCQENKKPKRPAVGRERGIIVVDVRHTHFPLLVGLLWARHICDTSVRLEWISFPKEFTDRLVN